MEHTKELLSVALSSLVPSLHNVRRHTAGQIEELAALIDATWAATQLGGHRAGGRPGQGAQDAVRGSYR